MKDLEASILLPHILEKAGQGKERFRLLFRQVRASSPSLPPSLPTYLLFFPPFLPFSPVLFLHALLRS